MSDTVLKRLNVSDVFTIPYEANKLWSVTASDFIEYGIFFQTGSYTSSAVKTDYNYSNLLYKSVLVNYYPEYYPINSLSTSSYYQTVNYTVNLTSTDYAVSGALRLGNLYSIEKNFYTSSIQLINIPNTLYSNKIIPTTFQATVSGGLINFNSVNNFGTDNITLDGGGLQWANENTTDISNILNMIY